MAPKKPVKTIVRLTKKSGMTKGEAMGAVKNLRAKPSATLTPRGQVQRSRKLARAEGLRAGQVKRLVKAERTVARNAKAKKG